MPTLYFFIGAVAGGIQLMVKRAEVKIFMKQAALIVIGIFDLCHFLPLSPPAPSNGNPTTVLSTFFYLHWQALLPPSPSFWDQCFYFLLLLGLYDETMRAITTFYSHVLFPGPPGFCWELFSPPSYWARHEASTTDLSDYSRLCAGFYCRGFPGIPPGRVALCVVTLAAGFWPYFWELKREEI